MEGGSDTLTTQPARILIVDDDDDTRQLLAFALGKRYEVVQAARAEAALDVLRSGAVDLVITDYDMPGQTGADLLKRAADEGILGDAASLVVTAHPDPEGVPDEVPLLRKPLDLERLLVQIRAILPGGDAAPPERAVASAPKTTDGAVLDLVLYVSPRSAASARARRRMDEVIAECGPGRHPLRGLRPLQARGLRRAGPGGVHAHPREARPRAAAVDRRRPEPGRRGPGPARDVRRAVAAPARRAAARPGRTLRQVRRTRA